MDSHFLALTDCFFNHANINYTLHTLASSVSKKSPDHLLTVAKMMLHETICMSFSDTGFCPFRRDPSITFEYEKMTKYQLTALEETIAYLTEMHELMITPKSSHGVFLYVHECNHAKFMVDPSLVLFATCALVYKSNPRRDYLDFTVFCNIILQRLCESKKIPQHLVHKGVDLARADIAELTNA